MKSLILSIVSIALLALGACTKSDDADKLLIDLKAGEEILGSVSLSVDQSLAIATVEGTRELFNIREMSWFEPSTGKWISLAQCKNWAEQSKTKSLNSTAAAPANMSDFLLWSLEPTFEAREANGTLTLKSGQIDYVIEGVASKKNAGRYFDYAVLNAYKKAMTEQKMLPFAELEALSAMSKLGYIPQKITVTFPGIPGAPNFVMEISEK